MNPQLFHDLAASEEASGYPENAAQLRAVPDAIVALRAVVSACECGALVPCKPDYMPGWAVVRLEMGRAALAALDATTTKEIEA